MKNKYILGTRGSKLALVQAESVKRKLLKASPEIEVEIKVITTHGDSDQKTQLTKFSDQGVFTGALEEALLCGEIDLAVHSLKDLPGKLAPGLKLIEAPPKRADYHDVLLVKSRPVRRIGTSSERRKLQMKELFPEAKLLPLRGNVPTRVKKLKEGDFDAIVLARAGLDRIGYDPRKDGLEAVELDVLPSPGQGILGIEIRESDKALDRMLSRSGDAFTGLQAKTERAFLEELGVDCEVPVGALLTEEDGVYRFRAFLKDRHKEVSLTDKNELEGAARALAGQLKRPGKVCLVGCGPGDPELITLKALKKIKSADVIVYDALLDPEILSQTEAECIYVGKRGSHHVKEQDEINELLYELALQGKEVVRLKGGDPYVFGRGVEEALFLIGRGIEVEVVPGISSVTGGSVTAGIPLTYRENNNAFAVVTAQTKKGGPPPDYSTLARFKGTLVFVMGITKLETIADGLINNGKDPHTSAAVIENATLKSQRVTTGTLETIVKKARDRDVKAPGLIVVGENVKLHNKLTKKKILVLRSRKQAGKLSKALKERGLEPIEFPLLEIVEDRDEVGRLKEDKESYTHLVFTSENGVDLFGKDVGFETYKNGRFYAIGPATKKALEAYGVGALHPDTYRAEDLARLIKKDLKPTDRVLLVHAKGSRPVLKTSLEEVCPVSEYFIYEAGATKEDSEAIYKKLSRGEIDGVAFTSSSMVRSFLNTFGKDMPVDYFSIGPNTSDTVREAGLDTAAQAESYTIDGLTEAIKKYYESTDET